MVSAPAVKPYTKPDETTALPFEALQTPPADGSDRAMLLPAHTDDEPAIVPAMGSGLTVTNCVAVAVPQLLVTEYDIDAVPARMPLTSPAEPTVAMVVPDDDHVPPDTASVNANVLPAHTVLPPVMVPATGDGFTVTDLVAVAVPQLLVTW